MPNTDQAAQIAQAAFQAPINNLVVVLAIAVMLFVMGVLFFTWRLFKYISNNDSPLVKVLREIRDAFNGMKTSTAEKTTQVITATNETNTILKDQTEELKNMGKVFGDHQIATHDTVANLSDKVDGLQTTVNTNTESIAALTEQIKALVDKLDDKAACADAEERMRQFRDEIKALLSEQQSKKTSEFPAVNVIADTDGSASPAAGSVAA